MSSKLTVPALMPAIRVTTLAQSKRFNINRSGVVDDMVAFVANEWLDIKC